MDRVYTSGAAATAPTAPASPSTGYPTGGSPGSGTPPTKPGPWWFHMMTEEMRAVIVAAGLTPDHEDLTQLSTAIQQLINDSAPSGGASAPVGSTRNAKMSVTSASSTATFTADEVIVETALGGTAYRLGSYSQSINLATTGAGGMDTGSAPTSGFVSLYAIAKADGTKNILACNASTSGGSIYSGSNMPAGYVASALIGVWPTNGSGQFVAAYQVNRSIEFVPVQVLSLNSGGATSFTPVGLSSCVPPNAKTWSGTLGGATTNSPSGCVAADPNGVGMRTHMTASGTSSPLNGFDYGASNIANVPLITAQTTYYKVQSASWSFRITVGGYDF